MSGEVVEDLQLHIEALNISDVDVDKLLFRVGALAVERDEARRIAASLEADLARILKAWDAYARAGTGDDFAGRYQVFLDAIEAAREWVGTDTPLAEHAAALAPHPDQP